MESKYQGVVGVKLQDNQANFRPDSDFMMDLKIILPDFPLVWSVIFPSPICFKDNCGRPNLEY